MMKQTLMAGVLLGATAFQAQAQQCIPYESLKEQWKDIPTTSVFRGLSDRGALTETFLNTDNGRYSTWVIPPVTPRIACLADQGQAGDSTPREFTVPENVSLPERHL